MNLIAAIGTNHSLGLNGELAHPKIKNDLRRFQQLTTGKNVVMGATTFFKDLKTNPLKNRVNLVITRKTVLVSTEKLHFFTFEDAKRFLSNSNLETFIIGGESIYRLFMPYVTKMYITHIQKEFEADTFLKVDWNEWQVSGSQEFKHYSFVDYDRKH